MKKEQWLPQVQLESPTTCPYKGHIHTAQIELYEHETPNVRKVDVKAVKGCVSRDLFRTTCYPDETTVRSFHFNPNAIELKPFEHEFYCLGDCDSLSDFDLSLRYWAHNAKVSADCAHIVRLDFAFDYQGLQQAEYVEQVILMRAIVAAFAAKYHVTNGEQYEGVTIFAHCWKNIKAVHQLYSVEAYNRRMKDADSPVRLRLEIRYGEQAKYRPTTHKTLSAAEIMNLLAEKLRSLYDMLPVVEDQFNRELLKEYRESHVNLNEFVKKEADRIFTRNQMIKLYLMVNKWATQEQAQNWADNHLYRPSQSAPKRFNVITPAKYKATIDACLQAMQTYVKNDGNFDWHLHLGEYENPDADRLSEPFTY